MSTHKTPKMDIKVSTLNLYLGLPMKKNLVKNTILEENIDILIGFMERSF